MRKRIPSSLTLVEPAELELAAAGDGARPFTMQAYSGGIANHRGYGRLVIDLAGLAIPKKPRPVLRDHDPGRICGHTESIDNSGRRVQASGVLSAGTPHAAEIATAADGGFPWQASLGVSIVRAAWLDDEEKADVNGRTFTGPLLIVREAQLREISFVALGADDNTSVHMSAEDGDAQPTIGVFSMGFEAWLAAKGFDVANLSDEQKAALELAWQAEQNPPPPTGGGSGGDPSPDTNLQLSDDDLVRRRAEEHRRIARIETLALKYEGEQIAELTAQAIELKWTAEKAELEFLRAARPAAPAAHSRAHDRDCNLEALQGAMLLRGGVALDNDRVFRSAGALALQLPAWLRLAANDDRRQKAMDFAHRYAAMSLYDLCAECVRLDGRHAFGRGEVIEMAFSTSSLTAIFTTNARVVVLETYMEAPDSTRGWTKETDVPDFKTNERPRMTKGPNLTRHPRGGEADHAEASDTAELFRIHRFSRQWVVDEQDVIDDSFNALSDRPRELALAAARVRPDSVYAELLANAPLADGVPLFHGTHGNLLTNGQLSPATLKAALTAMAIQQEDGVNLNLRATHLLMPTTLAFDGRQIIRSAEVRDTGDGATDRQYGTRNPLQDENLTPVTDSRLDNGVTDPVDGTTYAGSTADWYLACSWGHTIEVAYLRGTGRAPSVRTWRYDRDGKYGLGADVKIDVGRKALDHRSLGKAVE